MRAKLVVRSRRASGTSRSDRTGTRAPFPSCKPSVRGWLLLVALGLASLGGAGCSATRSDLSVHAPATTSATAQVERAPLAPEVANATPDSDTQAELAWEFLARVDETGLIQPTPTARPDRSETPPVAAADDDLPPLPSLGPPAQEPESTWLAWVPGMSDESVPANGNGRYNIEHDLLKVVGPFQRLANKDTYRYPLPKDVTGASVHKATLVRLQDYEIQRPGAYPAIVAFTRGRAYEALHAYDQALSAYQRVVQARTRFEPQASFAVEALTAFLNLKQRTPTGTTPVAYIQALDTLGQQWQELARHYAGTPYEALAQEEDEHIDRAKVAFIEINRHRIEDGNESVILAYQQLLDKHRDSKNRYRYRIELGDFYVALAREYAAQYDPESLRFDRRIFERLGQAALQHYVTVVQQDGTIEKLEAKGKLEALQAYMARVGRLGR